MLNALAAGLTIKVNDRASRAIDGIGRAFGRLQKKGKQLKAGLSAIGEGMRGLAMAGTGLAVSLGFMANKAANFEQQMSAVKSVMSASPEEFAALEAEIKRLGATTSKSATEAAEGAEFLARAGFDAGDTIKALSGVLRAAEADAIDMGTATNIVANTLRGFAMDATDATKVADVLALTSARTNTNMVQLGEGMKYVAPIARQLGQGVEDTSTALGLLANAGLQGSVGGTALKNMLLKLSTANDGTRQKLNELGIAVQDVNGNMLPLPQIIKNVAEGTGKLGGNMEQTAFLAETFGLRGQAAAGNLAAAFEKMSGEMVEVNGKMMNSFDALVHEINNAEGAAERMAEERLNNLKGAFTLLGSAMEGLSIEMFSGALKSLTPIIRQTAEAIGYMVEGMQNLDAIAAGDFEPTMGETATATKSTAMALAEFGAGIGDAMALVSTGVQKLGEIKTAILEAFGQEGGSPRSMAMFLTLGTMVLALLGVIAAAAFMMVLPFVFAGKAILTGVLIIASALYPVVIALGVLAAYFNSTREEGETMSERLSRAFDSVKAFAMDFYRGFMEGYETMIKPSVDQMKEGFAMLKEAFEPIFEKMGEIFGETADDGATFGVVVSAAVAGIVQVLNVLLSIMVPIIEFFVDNFVAPFLEGIQQIYGGFMDILDGSVSLKDGLTRILKGVINVLLNTVLRPYKMLLMGVFAAMNYVGIMSDATYKSIESTLNAEPGTLLGDTAEDEERGRERARESREAQMALAAQRRANVEGNGPPNINVETGDTTLNGCLENRLEVDGKQFTIASKKVEFELSQRGGFGMNPFQQGQITMNGGLPAGAR